MGKLWELLRRMLSGAPSASSLGAARTQALIQGSRAYLAKGHEDYLKSVVQANRSQACPAAKRKLSAIICFFIRLYPKGCK